MSYKSKNSCGGLLDLAAHIFEVYGLGITEKKLEMDKSEWDICLLYGFAILF